MKKSNLLPLLRELGVRPSRKLGQNFLVEPNLLEFIAQSVNPQQDELIIEVGSGIGNLTDLLISSGASLIAIEYDVRFAEYLRRKFQNFPTVCVMGADAARINYEELAAGRPYRCIGNLPYSASSVIIAKMLAAENKPTSMYLMLQQEMAIRLQSKPRCKSYGSLSVRAQVPYTMKTLKNFAPHLFWPAPKVNSVLMLLELKRDVPDFLLSQQLTKLVKLAFTHRRKKMLSNLIKSNYDRDIILSVFDELKIQESVRPDGLTPNQYLALTRLYQVCI